MTRIAQRMARGFLLCAMRATSASSQAVPVAWMNITAGTHPEPLVYWLLAAGLLAVGA